MDNIFLSNNFAVSFGRGDDFVEIMIRKDDNIQRFQFDKKYENDIKCICEFIDTMNMYYESLKWDVVHLRVREEENNG